ncbi:MAG TPA: ABC transporter permease, partial [Spirochaetaceae bacterium]|nr:ABC transporter permease [Spirochaetaceae bacterium]
MSHTIIAPPAGTAAATASPVKKRSQLAEVWRRLVRNKMAMFGLVVISLIIAAAITADWISPYDYRTQDLNAISQKPNAQHILGTDDLGRDILSRIIHGTRISLLVGFVSVSISVAVGGGLGAVSGYYGGTLDNVIMRFMD